MDLRICSDCRGTRMVWTRDGDIVCTGCGLVAEAHVIDDRPEWRSFGDDDGLEDPCRADVLKEDISPQERAQRMLLEKSLPNDDSLLIDTTIAKMVSAKGNHKGIAMLAVCLYKASEQLRRGFTAQQVCNMLHVESKTFWGCFDDCYDDKGHCRGSHSFAVCTRMIAGLEAKFEWFHDSHKPLVMKVLRQLLAIQLCASVKSSKLLASIVIMSCRLAGVSIVARDACQLLGVSMKTLQKHEGLIQEALATT